MSDNPYVALGTTDFADAAGKLLPQGDAWPRQPGSVQGGFMQALAQILAALHAQAGVLSETESFPPTALLLLADWEAAFGLPDPCTGPLPTVTQRQAALAARLIAAGGQSIPYFVAVAAALGFAITIQEYAPARCGLSGCGAALDAYFHWTVHAPASTTVPFRAGLSHCGEPLGAYGNQMLECMLKRIAPAHTVVNFVYG